jgi:hypothetical protein
MRFQAWLAMDFFAPVTLLDEPQRPADLGLDDGFVLMLSEDWLTP